MINAFAARPEFELYDLKRDPDQIDSVASNPEYAKVLEALTARLMTTLHENRRSAGRGRWQDLRREKPYVDPAFPTQTVEEEDAEL